jgi:hypothetical protein
MGDLAASLEVRRGIGSLLSTARPCVCWHSSPPAAAAASPLPWSVCEHGAVVCDRSARAMVMWLARLIIAHVTATGDCFATVATTARPSRAVYMIDCMTHVCVCGCVRGAVVRQTILRGHESHRRALEEETASVRDALTDESRRFEAVVTDAASQPPQRWFDAASGREMPSMLSLPLAVGRCERCPPLLLSLSLSLSVSLSVSLVEVDCCTPLFAVDVTGHDAVASVRILAIRPAGVSGAHKSSDVRHRLCVSSLHRTATVTSLARTSLSLQLSCASFLPFIIRRSPSLSHCLCRPPCSHHAPLMPRHYHRHRHHRHRHRLHRRCAHSDSISSDVPRQHPSGGASSGAQHRAGTGRTTAVGLVVGAARC